MDPAGFTLTQRASVAAHETWPNPLDSNSWPGTRYYSYIYIYIYRIVANIFKFSSHGVLPGCLVRILSYCVCVTLASFVPKGGAGQCKDSCTFCPQTGAPSAFVSLQTRVYPTFVPFVCVTLSLLLFVCLLSCIDLYLFFTYNWFLFDFWL